MEEYLEKMLELKLVRIPGDEDHLFDGINATIGTFSAKIRIAHRLGLISKTLHDSLDIVRKIRNDFAHNVFECDFSNQSVRDRLSNLKRVMYPAVDNYYDFLVKAVKVSKYAKDAMQGSTERQQFLASAIVILMALSEDLKRVQSVKEAKPESLFHAKRCYLNKPFEKIEL